VRLRSFDNFGGEMEKVNGSSTVEVPAGGAEPAGEVTIRTLTSHSAEKLGDAAEGRAFGAIELEARVNVDPSVAENDEPLTEIFIVSEFMLKEALNLCCGE